MSLKFKRQCLIDNTVVLCIVKKANTRGGGAQNVDPCLHLAAEIFFINLN